MGIRSQRGATIIFVAVAMFGLLAFAALAVDYGILWVARGQAQTAADAAVMAAAQSMAFDSTKDFAAFKVVGQAAAKQNKVWGQAPYIEPADIDFPACPPSPGLPADPTCVHAHVYRNQAHSNGIPMLFGSTFGINFQGVQATATARAVAANATNCLKPWAVADKWLDSQPGGWSQFATYDAAAGDSYTPPSANNFGNGFSARDVNGVPTYYGYQMVLKYANPGNGPGSLPINSAGWAMELALNNAAGPINAAGTYQANISDCTSDIVAISPQGSTCTAVNPLVGCVDVRPGSTGSANSKGVG
ncbi:MAG: pilus assembly protein TadG-related protein, partial [Vicinamibacterales bacterium]